MNRVRIQQPGAKFGAVFVGMVLAFLVGLSLVETVGRVPAEIASELLIIVEVYWFTRVFRGATEPVDPPRPVWKMTARRPASIVLAIYFALQFMSALGTISTLGGVGVLGAVANAAFAGAYAYSAYRLGSDPTALEA